MNKNYIVSAACRVTSTSANGTLLRDEYAKLWAELCDDYKVENPYSLNAEDTSKFFVDLSTKWKARKAKMFKDGLIPASDV